MILYYCFECGKYIGEEDIVAADVDARDAGFSDICKKCGDNVVIAERNY